MSIDANNMMAAILEEYYKHNSREFTINTYYYLKHQDDERVMNELFKLKYISKISKIGQTYYKIYLEDSFFEHFKIPIK